MRKHQIKMQRNFYTPFENENWIWPLPSSLPQIWNQILLAIRTSPSLSCFKHHLKTHHFSIPRYSDPPSDSLQI